MVSESYTESAISDRIKNFFKEFDHGKYIKKIDELTGSNLQINFYDLFDYDNKRQSDFKIHQLFLEKTELAIKQTKRAVKEIYQERYGSELAEKLEVNILIDKSELEITVNQAIKNKYVNKLVSLKGRISGESPIKTRLVKGVWNCNDGHEFESLIEPIKCQNGKCSNRIIKQNSSKSEYEYYRNFYLKDYENVDHNADTLVCEAKGDLTESAKNGEVVNVIGYITVELNGKNLFNILHLLNLKKVNEVSYDTTDQEKQILESDDENERRKLEQIQERIELGNFHYDDGNYDNARDYYKLVLEDESNNPEALDGYALMLAILGELEESIMQYDKLLILKPGYYVAMLNNAWSHILLENYPEALGLLDELENKNSEDPLVISHKCWLMEKMDELAETINYCKKALDNDQNDIRAIKAYSLSLSIIGNYTQALPYHERLYTMYPDDDATIINYATTLAHSDNVQLALELYDYILDKYPNQPDVTKVKRSLCLQHPELVCGVI